jgi:hypothetical protein
MASHQIGMLGHIQAQLFFQHPHNGDAGGHDRRLGIFGECEIGLRTLPHQPGKLLGKRVVHFLEDLAGRTESVGQLLGHADLLAALAGK